MATSLVLLLLLAAATAGVVRQLNANHHRATARPTGDDVADRDIARVRQDLAAARSTSDPGAVRARSVQGATAGRRIAPPTARAA